MTRPTELLVNRRDLRSYEVREGTVPEINAGEALLRIERFSLTSNNLTYALAGNAMGYWEFFPGDEVWGRLPVWGFAEVEASESPELSEGVRVFGLLPPTGHVVLRPARSDDWGLVDWAPHRAGLPPVYNAYFEAATDPLYDAGREDQLALLRILFMTAYLIEQDLAATDPPLEVVMVSSASSKTALALAHLLRSRGGRTVVGLTSDRNLAFVEGTGAYDGVLAYDDVDSLAGEAVVYVDFAGNEEVRERVHKQIGAGLQRSITVGAAHWGQQGGARARRSAAADGGGTDESFAYESSGLSGPRPELFFAGDHLNEHMGRLGPTQFWVELGRAWDEFVAWTDGWLDLQHVRGARALEAAYQALVAGAVDASVGYVVEPWAR